MKSSTIVGVGTILRVLAAAAAASSAGSPSGRGNWFGRVLLGGKPANGENDDTDDDNGRTRYLPPPPPPSGAIRRYPQQQRRGGLSPPPPFPPPPPPGQYADGTTSNTSDEVEKNDSAKDGNESQQKETLPNPPPPPPPPPYMNMPYGAGGVGGYWFDGLPPPIPFLPASSGTVIGGRADDEKSEREEDENKGPEGGGGGEQNDGAGEDQKQKQQKQQQQRLQQTMPPHPPGRFWGSEPGQPQQQQYPPLPGYHDPWHGMDPRHQQQQQQMQAQYEDWEAGVDQSGITGTIGGSNDAIEYLQSELEASAGREADLMHQIGNLTSTLSAAKDTANGRLHTIDVLTERIAETEARAAAEGNAAKELKANCTELADTALKLRKETTRWEEKCAALEEQSACDAKEVQELREELGRKQAELEDLACAIEEDRVDAERERYLEEIRQRRKKRGFLAVLFGGIFGKGYDEEEERLKAQELARSTLIDALQTERSNVDELEASLLILQQNNSAIADMVESRDYLINELNDRVAVFEEDKIVLKAALRQLQKEMKEEGPKTQKVALDLKKAQDGELDTSAVATTCISAASFGIYSIVVFPSKLIEFVITSVFDTNRDQTVARFGEASKGKAQRKGIGVDGSNTTAR